MAEWYKSQTPAKRHSCKVANPTMVEMPSRTRSALNRGAKRHSCRRGSNPGRGVGFQTASSSKPGRGAGFQTASSSNPGRGAGFQLPNWPLGRIYVSGFPWRKNKPGGCLGGSWRSVVTRNWPLYADHDAKAANCLDQLPVSCSNCTICGKYLDLKTITVSMDTKYFKKLCSNCS